MDTVLDLRADLLKDELDAKRFIVIAFGRRKVADLSRIFASLTTQENFGFSKSILQFGGEGFHLFPQTEVFLLRARMTMVTILPYQGISGINFKHIHLPIV